MIMRSLNIKERKLLELQIAQNQTPSKHFEQKKVQDSQKWKKYLWNVHKIEGAHLQFVNNHYAKFEYKGMNTVGVTDYTN